MNSNKTGRRLDDKKIHVKIKLSALWAALMFLYIYVDIFDFYKIGEMEHIIAGNMGPFPTTQVALLSALILMAIPSLMVFLSLALPAKVNRWTNILVAAFYILVGINNIIGESWVFYIVGNIVEIVILSLIIRHAWKWPTQET